MSDELDLVVRAVQEVEPAVRDFAAAVAGSATAEVSEMLADKVRLRRFKSQLKILEKAKQAAEAAGLPPHAVPLKVLAPLLEQGSLEEEGDENMVTRWANLLANAATESVAEVPPGFPDILRQLDGLAASMLDALFEHSRGSVTRNLSSAWSHRGFEHALGLERGTIGEARLEDLVRLGLAHYPSEQLGRMISVDHPMNKPATQRTQIGITALGLALVRACRAPEPAVPPPPA